MKSLKTKLTENLDLNMPCILRNPPEILSIHNKYVYIPYAFAIGPLHHGRTWQIEDNEEIKLKYLKGILHRSSIDKLQELEDVVSQVEEKAWKCYKDHVEPYPANFVEMLVLDGSFIIELFRKFNDKNLREPDDPIFTFPNLFQNLNHDLVLLSNQIPWFVLEKLFDLTKIGDEHHQVPLDHLTLKFFGNKVFGNMFTPDDPKTNKLPWEKIRSKGTKHILDLLRDFLIYSYEEYPKQSSCDWMSLPSVTTLSQSGVKFKPVSGMSILDVQFNNGCLEIPSILLQNTTETIFLNLVSLEQFVPNYRLRITSYVNLIGKLIDTKEDIQVLQRNKIWLSNEKATKIFNQQIFNQQLYKGPYFMEFHYSTLCKRVDAFCNNQGWIKFPRRLLNPWETCRTIIIIIVLFCKILQAYCYFKQAG